MPNPYVWQTTQLCLIRKCHFFTTFHRTVARLHVFYQERTHSQTSGHLWCTKWKPKMRLKRWVCVAPYLSRQNVFPILSVGQLTQYLFQIPPEWEKTNYKDEIPVLKITVKATVTEVVFKWRKLRRSLKWIPRIGWAFGKLHRCFHPCQLLNRFGYST